MSQKFSYQNSNPTVEIFSQGEEIVTGQVADTNAAWLSQQLVKIGFTLTRHSAVGDKLTDLIDLLAEIVHRRPDCCICTGGLGATCDDLTAEAVAKAFDLPLQFDAIAFAQISDFYYRRNTIMPDINRKQAMLPYSALRIDNPVGTAPGFCLSYQNCWFVFLPGVPSEMQHLFTETVVTDLKNRFSPHPSQLVTIKTRDIGESQLQEKMNQLSLPKQVQLGFRASLDEVHTKLLFPPAYAVTDVAMLVAQVVEKIGETVFAVEGL
jgi:molybdenum cofactor synthesis domain-containing protein